MPEGTCHACRHANPAGARFCNACGVPLAAPTAGEAGRFTAPRNYTPRHLAEKILILQGSLRGERKQLTVLFCDLVGSTALAEQLGPEPMHDLLSRFFEIALAEIHRLEGTINQFLGDGFMALFGAPIAHEDHARRAVLAALGIQRALRERAATLPGEAAGELAVRMGLNTGPVVVGAIGDDLRMDYTAVGDTTNLAARLQQRAERDAILVGPATARLVRREIALEPLGLLEVRGKAAPVQAYRVVGVRARTSPFDGGETRPLSPFVGRQHELRLLREAVDVVAGGRGRVVMVAGDPGAGKSRLLHELARGPGAHRLTWLEGRCLPHGATVPFLPLLDVLRARCGIGEADGGPAIVAGVHAAIERAGADPTERAPYLLHLLGVKEGAEGVPLLPPDVIKTRTFGALREVILAGVGSGPMAVVIEDVHWIDGTSEEFLAALAERLPGAPLLLLVTWRLGHRPVWIDRFSPLAVTLSPLSADESLRVARAAGAADLADPVTEAILRKAEGNPFFLEELTRGALERPVAEIPDTIHAVLAARIDRLSEGTKAVLQAAAVLGREFSSRLLERVWNGGDLAPHLEELRRRALVHEGVRPEGRVHVFRHALTEAVAYDSLLGEHRRQLHHRVVEALEGGAAGRADAQLERLAHHTFRAGLWDKTVSYARQAGLKASARSANREAATLLGQAIAALEELPDGRDKAELAIDLRVDLRHALMPLGEFARAASALEMAETHARALGDARRLGWILMYRCHALFLACDLVQARELGTAALAIAAQTGDARLATVTRFYLGPIHFHFGDYRECAEVFDAGIAALGDERGRERLGLASLPAVLGGAFLAQSLAFTGEFARAATVGDEATGLAEAAQHPYSLTLGLWGVGVARGVQGDLLTAAAALERGLGVSGEWGIAYHWPLLAGPLGHVRALAGRTEEAVALLEESFARARSMNFRLMLAAYAPYLVDAYLLAGRLDDAHASATTALALTRDVHTRGWEAMLQRLLGQIAAARRPPRLTEAAGHYAAALARAEALGMRPLVAHCHADLADLHRCRGERDRAREHLATALALYRELPMPFWQARTAAAFADL